MPEVMWICELPVNCIGAEDFMGGLIKPNLSTALLQYCLAETPAAHRELHLVVRSTDTEEFS